MTRLEFLEAALSTLSRKNLSHQDGAILCIMSRFDGITLAKLGRILHKQLGSTTMRNLILCGLVHSITPPSRRQRPYFLTSKGSEMIASMMGRRLTHHE
jgi:chromosome segregation and condensation protein ScpB